MRGQAAISKHNPTQSIKAKRTDFTACADLIAMRSSKGRLLACCSQLALVRKPSALLFQVALFLRIFSLTPLMAYLNYSSSDSVYFVLVCFALPLLCFTGPTFLYLNFDSQSVFFFSGEPASYFSSVTLSID